MARVKAPLLSFGASGQIGKSQVYANWRGIPYARELTKPANPRSAGQTSTRNVFSLLCAIWKLAPGVAQAPWTANASGRPYTNRNKFISANLGNLRAAADLQDFIGSPGAGGGLAPSSVVAAVAGSDVTVTVTPPELPTGWTVDSAVAWAIPDGDPQTDVKTQTYAASDDATPFAPVLNGLPSGDYVVTGWVVYDTGGGKLAYGPSLATTATVA